ELTDNEVASLTRAMLLSGKKFNYTPRKVKKRSIVVDKHCIGGVAANRTTALVVPIVAAAGYLMPKTSSRSITSPAGTSDTMEVLCNVSLSMAQMKKTLNAANACLVWGGSLDLAPADDKIIRVEHPMSLDPVGQLIASILAKKKSVNSTHVMIDIPLGTGAKIERMDRAVLLKNKFEKIGRMLGMKVKVLITDGSQPIGNGIGPALEARDILWTLQNDPRGSKQLKEKSIYVAGEIFEMIGESKKGKGHIRARQIFDSGLAYKKFVQIIKVQGPMIWPVDAKKISIGKFKKEYLAPKSGTITTIDNKGVSRIAKLLGAPSKKGAGVFLKVHVKDKVKKGQPLYELYAINAQQLSHAFSFAKKEPGIVIK
ncbi:MAG TPA: thymidine phosphorylase, partial [Acidobacteriota bacterium]|nr:thymidine phosphorylase [Acidobacteriota bacterium]